MELRSGYKQTEIGVIPEDWNPVMLNTITSEIGDGIHATPAYSSNGEYFFINGNNICDGHIVVTEDTKLVDHSEFKKHKKNLGDRTILLSINGTIGNLGLFAGEAVMLGKSAAYLNVKSEIGKTYVYHSLQTESVRRQFNDGLTGTTIRNLGLTTIRNTQIALPPTKSEQEAIAEALSDADALSESIEQLITKKRHIKQGAMQELLSPKPDDEVRLLRDVSTMKGRIGWQGLNQTEFTSNDDEPFLITGMNFKDGAIRWNEVYHISEPRYEMAKEIQLRAGDVLMTKDGTIGKILYIDNIPCPGKASLNSHLLLFRPIRESYNSRYLYYQLSSQRFKDFIELSKYGTTFFGISQAAVGNYPVLLPPIEDQVRIASILSDMDAEIAAIEIKLAKTRALKQGMMHNLLTGRIRLI